jgi:hypothetical protein
MTEKENFLKVIRGETPAWVPRWYGGIDPYATKPPSSISVSPGFISAKRTPEGGFMFWGSAYGPKGDEALVNRRKWMTSEYEAYRETPYK